MKTTCVRHGQIEVGVIEHEGHEYTALGASVQGKAITGYTKSVRGGIDLTSWCGKTMLGSRSEVVETFWSGNLALMFRLTGGKYIVGYALGENGMLFRGELISDCDDEEARRHALMLSDCFAELDAEDEAAYELEMTPN